MSYCRFSSDNFKCDVYCYEHVGGYWQIHVAEQRYDMLDFPDSPPIEQVEEWILWQAKRSELMETARLESIGLSLDGNNYQEHSPGDAADRLEEIRAAGYHVPQYAIDRLREEQEEGYQGEDPE